MIDHIGIDVKDYAKSKAFYEKVLAPLGYTIIEEIEEGGSYIGFGTKGAPQFWIHQSKTPTSPLHIAFVSPDRKTVDAFYKTALKASARDNGKPGIREIYHPHYYGAFVLDPDGHNIEAVCHHPE